MQKIVFAHLNAMCQGGEVCPRHQLVVTCLMYFFNLLIFPTNLIGLLTPTQNKILFLLKIAVVLIHLIRFCRVLGISPGCSV